MNVLYRSKSNYRRKTIERKWFDAQTVLLFVVTLALFTSMYKNHTLNTQVKASEASLKDQQLKEVSIAEQIGFGAYIKEVEKEVVRYDTPTTVEDKIRATFPENPERAIAIFKCESGLRPNAFNGKNTNGTWDAGLAQINSIHGVSKSMLMDINVNLAVARVIYERAGNSFTPWVCNRKV